MIHFLSKYSHFGDGKIDDSLSRSVSWLPHPAGFPHWNSSQVDTSTSTIHMADASLERSHVTFPPRLLLTGLSFLTLGFLSPGPRRNWFLNT